LEKEKKWGTRFVLEKHWEKWTIPRWPDRRKNYNSQSKTMEIKSKQGRKEEEGAKP